MESYISLGGTIFYSLSLRKHNIFGQLYEKGIKQKQNKPMETTLWTKVLLVLQ